MLIFLKFLIFVRGSLAHASEQVLTQSLAESKSFTLSLLTSFLSLSDEFGINDFVKRSL